MDDLLSAFIFFYGIAWAAAMSTTGRFKSFNTRWWREGGSRRFGRYFVSFVVCNVLPFSALAFFVIWDSTLNRSPEKLHAHELVAAAIASLSAFSLSRLLHGFLLLLRPVLYTQDEFDRESTEWDRIEPDPNYPPMRWWEHLAPGVVMFLLPLCVAVLIVTLWPTDSTGGSPTLSETVPSPMAGEATRPTVPVSASTLHATSIDWIEVAALALSSLAIWYTIQESRRNNRVILRLRRCAFTYSFSAADPQQSNWTFQIVFQNCGIAIHDVHVVLEFRDSRGHGVFSYQLQLSNGDHVQGAFEKGMVGAFEFNSVGLRQESGRLAFLSAFTDPVKQQAEIRVYSQSYFAYSFRAWNLWERLREHWYQFAVKLNNRLLREVGKNEQGVPIVKAYFELPTPVVLLWPLQCLAKELSRHRNGAPTRNEAMPRMSENPEPSGGL